jgi:L-fucose isomerase-like protein
MKHNVRLGVICLARTTFDYREAENLYKDIIKDLETLENAEIIALPQLVIEPEEARAAALELAGRDIDGLAVISGTFHLGHLVLEALKVLKKPVLLWGLPELPYNGGKIRLNSVCGVNLNASNLYKSGIRNYHVNVGPRIDEDWVDAVRIIRAYKDTRIGILGFRARGFFNLGVYDLNVYREMGVLIDHYELNEVWQFPVEESRIAEKEKQVRQIFVVSELTDLQVKKVAELTARMEGFLEKHGLTALAIRCWPEFADGFGISPCAAMSILQSEGRILTCEGDVEGSLSMVAHRAVGGETPYLFDFSQIDFEDDTALLWHCGVAPCNLWDGTCERSLSTYFAGGRGVTADFVLKNGEVSVLRFDSAGTDYRTLLARGRVIPMEKELRGTYMKVKFDKPVKEVFNLVVENGVAHHASVVYGDFIKPFEIFSKIQGWEILK